MNRKVLIITYYWPPSGGSGVQRWVKFVKYIRRFGWEPVIYTPSNPELPVKDSSLYRELPKNITVLKRKIVEPYGLYKKFTGRKQVGVGFMKEEASSSRMEEFFKWIRGNFFIPDARKLWIKPSIRFLTRYLQKHSVDALVSTGPPHSMHLIAKGIKETLNIPWLADFRDPWTNIDFYDELHLTKCADRKHHRLEYEVLTTADGVTVVSPTMKEDLEAISGRSVELLTNGFDPQDFSSQIKKTHNKFTIAHIGSMVATRNPPNLWPVLKELIEDQPNFANHLNIALVGKVDHTITQTIEDYNLTSFVSKPGYMSHDEVVSYQQKCHLLLLVLNDTPNAKCLLPGKLFEYLAAQRPIVTIGPKNSDAGQFMELSNHYSLVDHDDTKPLKTFIMKQFESFIADKPVHIQADINVYSRVRLTERLTELLNQLIE